MPRTALLRNVTGVKYAKLAHPRLFNAVPRPRLFAHIDALRRSHSVIWIGSPPGAGKTTLVASYLSAGKAPSVWYQVDEGDADPANFFFFLAQTVRQKGPALPWLAPELADDIPRFARVFFREYFARLPERGIVVFDNIQEFDWERLGHLLEIAFSEVPEGITVVAISRHAPPDRLARLELSGRIGALGWGDLRLNADESRALARLDDRPPGDGDAWLEKIDGWAAGIVMLREHMDVSSTGASLPGPAGPEAQEAVFRYFAGEILGRMPPASQRLLLLLSCLPGISAADAQGLTGDPAAGRLLGRLFHQRLFVDRRGPAPFTYHFHALFREFLQYEADRRLDPDERAALLERAAAILESQGRVEEAARLWQQARAWPKLARLLLERAGGMLATGRGQTWREWLGWIPPEVADAHPRLRYWHGASLNHADPARARDVLARAERDFLAGGDTLYRLLALAAILESYYYEWADFQALPGWVHRMAEALRGVDPGTLDAEADLQIHSRLALALSLTDPDSPLIRTAAARSLRALPRVASPAERAAAGAFVMNYLNWGDAAAARDLAMILAPLLDDPTVAPFPRISCYRSIVYRHQFDGNMSAAQAMLDKAQRLLDDFGLVQMQFQLHFRQGLNLLGTRAVPQAAGLIEQMRRMVSPARKLEQVYVRILEAACFAQTGAVARALQAAQEAVQTGAEAKLTATTRWQITMLLAYCQALTGNLQEARAGSVRAIDAAYGPEKASAREEADFLAAYIDLVDGRPDDAARLLQELLRGQRERGACFPMLLRVVPQVAEALLPLALREGIEVEHVRSTILAHAFSPPDRLAPDWPWPLAVRAFGAMELSFHGEMLKSGGKAQKRPLLLLKALLAAGGSGKSQATLAAQLWPEVDDPKASLNVTLHRLRKLLGDEKAIAVVSGNVLLDDSRVWTDVRAFADLCEQAHTLVSGDADAAALKRTSEALMALYRGPFCADDEEPWLMAAREGCRRRFVATVGRLGEALESRQEWAAARALYTRALDAEPLAEAGHRGLMRCAHAQNDQAAVFSAYRRCREILSVVLGRTPSPETEALVVELGR